MTWLLAIPRRVVLCFLGVAAAVVAASAWFGTLVTGRYPMALFDFAVGVLRWSVRAGGRRDERDRHRRRPGR